MNIFIQLMLLLLLLSQFLCISANSYGAYCGGDSDCDQHQKCMDNICHCNLDERRFWTGEICAICVVGFTVTFDRCYKSFDYLKTWADARAFCRSQYADLFTWRNNLDEEFIRPVVQMWASSNIFLEIMQINQQFTHPHLAWAGATITSLNPYTTQWVDPDGIKLDLYSNEWCDPTRYSGYVLPKEPTSGSRTTPNGTEREECVTYNFGTADTDLLCLADDYCSQQYPFICEMNAASMKLANSVLDGNNDDNINFEEVPPSPPPLPPPPVPLDSAISQLSSNTEIDPGYINSPSALVDKTSGLSMSHIITFIGIGIILVVGAIVGYMFLKKRKENPLDNISKNEEASQDGGPTFTSSVGDMMDE